MKKPAFEMNNKTALISFFFFAIISCSHGQTKQICFTIDDLPLVGYGINDTIFQEVVLNNLIRSLNNNQIPAIGFVNEHKLYNGKKVNPFQVRQLTKWVDSGLELGNHTYSHPDYNNVPFDDFTEDILRGEIITKEIMSKRGEYIKYFRHPFLHMGNTKSKADSLNEFLEEHDYRVAPVTIDNDDYLFAVAYHRAYMKRDRELMAQIGQDYVEYMEKKLLYFEMQANKLFGRNISQILLLHSSLLNSDYMDTLAEMCRKNGYDFVNIDTALEDESFKTEISVFGNWGISWIDRWALSFGKKGDFFKLEPATPDHIKKLSK
jgi:peptidoglycan/xylan/chitin deacetylase (PgdA/CDA1 family)